jgi:outer membrane protein assembly factor BamD (BamD/ComL family)
MRYGTLRNWLVLVLLANAPVAVAQPDRGILIREAVLRVAPDATEGKLGTVGRGREVVVIDKSRDWVKVFANVDREKNVTGWILEKGIVRPSTPNGDQILYGEAIDSEDQASRRRGRKGAAEDAMHLYARMAEYFPNSPLAGEALYRAADIRWQLDSEDVWTRPSAKEQSPDVRPKINDQSMKEVMKKFPNTKWAQLAAFHLLDNKICGDWQAQSKCPEKETELYEKYAEEYPQSPKAPEALYDAAWRQAALIEIYKTEEQPVKSTAAKAKAATMAQRVVSQYGQSEWASRAKRLLFLMDQNIPTWGNVAE